MSDYADLIKKLWAKVDEIDDGGSHYSKSAIYRDAANAIASLIASLANEKEARERLEFELAARDVNDPALDESIDKMQEGFKLLQLHQSKRRKTR